MKPYAFGKDRVTISSNKKIQAQKRKSPIVKGGTCPKQCWFKDLNNYWCETSINPMVTAGWQWDYVNQNNIFSIKLEPYLTTVASTTNEFLLARLMSFIFQFDLIEFKSNMFYMITAAPDQMCWGIGYALQPIQVRLDVNYYFMNCKKKVIANIRDYKDSWTGKSAKWIDECVAPDTSPIIRIFDIDFTKGVGETAVIGGTTTGK